MPITSLIARSLGGTLLVAATLLPSRPAVAQMRDSEPAAPRTWPVVPVPPPAETGAALLREVAAAVELLPGQLTATRRVQTDAPDALAPATTSREILVALTAAQLGRLRQWQAAHPQQAALLGLPAGPR